MTDSKDIFTVTIYDENRFDEPAPDTTNFLTLFEAMTFAYTEGYKEKRSVLNICVLNTDTGAVQAIYEKKALFTMFINRDHDEEMEDRIEGTNPFENEHRLSTCQLVRV